MREVDRLAVERLGIPSLLLMENAASACGAAVLEMLGAERGDVLVVCGSGNNGGDGLALLRHLDAAGVRATALLVCGEPRTDDARANLAMALRSGLDVRVGPDEVGVWFRAQAQGLKPAVIVDAIFGTGLSRAVDAEMAAVIGTIGVLRSQGARVLAVDVPSGLDADTGQVLGVCVRAHVTMTLVALKQGIVAGLEHCGDVRVAGIGLPRTLLEPFTREID